MSKTQGEWTVRMYTPDEHIRVVEGRLAAIPKWRWLKRFNKKRLIKSLKRIYANDKN